MRAASTPCTVGGNMQTVRGALSREPIAAHASPTKTPSSASVCTTSSMKNGVPSVFSRMSCLRS